MTMVGIEHPRAATGVRHCAARKLFYQQQRAHRYIYARGGAPSGGVVEARVMEGCYSSVVKPTRPKMQALRNLFTVQPVHSSAA